MLDARSRSPLASAPDVLEHEARWPVAFSILVILLILAALPRRLQLFPLWAPYALALMVLVPLALVAMSRGEARWVRLERIATLGFGVAAAGSTVANLAHILVAMIERSHEVTGLQLLGSSIGVWIGNVIGFALLYWQIDRGGPLGRASAQLPAPDWQFPQQQEAPPPGERPWRPTFPDYLFLGYCTATAFSPTDALPLTTRAKMLVMVESTISLATIVVVAARAINILGS